MQAVTVFEQLETLEKNATGDVLKDISDKVHFLQEAQGIAPQLRVSTTALHEAQGMLASAPVLLVVIASVVLCAAVIALTAANVVTKAYNVLVTCSSRRPVLDRQLIPVSSE